MGRAAVAAACVVEEVADGVGFEVVAVRLVEVHGHVGVLLLELCQDLVVPLDALVGAVDAVPEADTLAFVGDVVVLLLACAELVPIMRGARGVVQVVKGDLSGTLDVVGAVARPSHIVAEAARLMFAVAGILVAEVVVRALAREGVPMRIAAGNVRRVAVGSEDAFVEGDVLATDDIAPLPLGLLAVVNIAPSSVKGLEGTEVGLRVRVQVACVLHGYLQAPDAGHPKLARAHDDHLMVHVPQSPGQARCVDVLVGIVLVILYSVHVELLFPGAPVRQRLVPLLLLRGQLSIVEIVRDCRKALPDDCPLPHRTVA
mmetsp:Transcript_95042/g.183237  ORF Transcript_95042/g.183237 Transcript_95042/m.183237 type:complete len:315 (-) Transcript_95042:6-950(-)